VVQRGVDVGAGDDGHRLAHEGVGFHRGAGEQIAQCLRELAGIGWQRAQPAFALAGGQSERLFEQHVHPAQTIGLRIGLRIGGMR
jgi:hypothetical protein